MDRILCIDYGQKRLGIAISDPLGMTAQSHPYVLNTPDCFGEIQKIVDEYNVTKMILGMPINQHGAEGKQAENVRRFSTKLNVHFPDFGINFQDERFSTKAVTRHLIDAGVSRKKRKQVVDSQSAAFILQGYLDRIS